MIKKIKKNSNLEYNLYINNLNGILQSLSLNLVIPFASLYAKRLNATDNDIAMLNSYPAIFCIIAVFLGTYLFKRYKNKKMITSIFFGFGRLFFLFFILVPFLPIKIQPALFVLLYGMMNFPNAIANMGWQSYIADLFSSSWRGRAFSKRSSLSTISAFVVTVITGNLLYYIPHNEHERIQLYQTFFFVAFIFAIFEIHSFTRHKLDKSNKQLEIISDYKHESILIKVQNIYNLFKENKNFLSFCICIVIFHFAWQMGWPVFFSYEYDVLHSNESWTALTSTVSFISQALAYPLWQKLSERKGNTFALSIAAFMLACCPFFYMFARSMYYVVGFTVITAIAAAGVILLLLNNLYEVSPNKDRTLYIAIYTIITNITLIFAPIIGMEFKSLFNIYISLFIVGMLRVFAAILLYYRYRVIKKNDE